MMTKKILLPFTLSTIAVLMQGCGGESAKINENPSQGGGITPSTSCNVNNDECVQFVLDYPIAGLNFDCSSDSVNHFETIKKSNAVSGACKLGDTVTFYLQGKESRKISLGSVELDKIYKVKDNRYPIPRIRLIDIASGLTGKTPIVIDQNDETTRVAIALVKIFQSIGIEQENNLAGDIQPTEFSEEKKNLLSTLTKDISLTELANGEYINILKPWLDTTQISDTQALSMLNQLVNFSNMGVWQAWLPFLKGSVSATTDGFYGCNQTDYSKCLDGSLGSNLIHSMGSFLLLTDRQGYTIGAGEQWVGPVKITNGTVAAPYVLTTTEKPKQLQIYAQNQWMNSINHTVNTNFPLRLSVSNNNDEDLRMTQGKLLNGHTIPGIESVYKRLMGLKETDSVADSNALGRWEQKIYSQKYNGTYNGTLEIYKTNPTSYLENNVFRTKDNVKTGERYIFPLYATLNFTYADNSLKGENIKLGIVIDEYGDIRTDIKKDSTSTDMSGNGRCLTASAQEDGTYLDTDGITQYRIGTSAATNFEETDKSLAIRVLLSNPRFGILNGTAFGLNTDIYLLGVLIRGAKINLHNLLEDSSSTNITLTDFEIANNTVYWVNSYARYHNLYIAGYDAIKDDKVRNGYEKPTDAERDLAKRWYGSVTISLADQSNSNCKAIRYR